MPINYSKDLYASNFDYVTTFENEKNIILEKAKARDKRFFVQILLGANKVLASNGEEFSFKSILFSKCEKPNATMSDYVLDFNDYLDALNFNAEEKEIIVDFTEKMKNYALDYNDIGNIQENAVRNKNLSELNDYFKLQGFTIPENKEELSKNQTKIDDFLQEKDKSVMLKNALLKYNENIKKRENAINNSQNFDNLLAELNVCTYDNLSDLEKTFYDDYVNICRETDRKIYIEINRYKREREKELLKLIAENQNDKTVVSDELKRKAQRFENETYAEIDKIKNSYSEVKLLFLSYVKGLEVASKVCVDKQVYEKIVDFVNELKSEYSNVSVKDKIFGKLKIAKNKSTVIREKINYVISNAKTKLGINEEKLNLLIDGKHKKLSATYDKNFDYNLIQKQIYDSKVNEINGNVDYKDKVEVTNRLIQHEKKQGNKETTTTVNDTLNEFREEDKSFHVSLEDLDDFNL